MVIPIYTFDIKKDKKIFAGHLIGDAFLKQVKKEHFMRKENGYGIQDDVLQELKARRCTNIVIKGNGLDFVSKLSDWLRQPIKDYGHGEQRFLSIEEKEQNELF